MQSFVQYRTLCKTLQAEQERDEEQLTESDPQKDAQFWDRQTEPRLRLERTGTGDLDIHRSLESSTHTLRVDMGPPTEVERADFDLPLDDQLSRTSFRAADNRSSLTVTGISLSADKGKAKAGSFIVSFESEDDPMDPHNWGLYYRALYTSFIIFMAASVEFVAIADSPALERAATGKGVIQYRSTL
jgi:hypothetical protein